MDTLFNPDFSASCPKGSKDMKSKTADYISKMGKEIQPFVD
jgi:hypothetical protein